MSHIFFDFHFVGVSLGIVRNSPSSKSIGTSKPIDNGVPNTVNGEATDRTFIISSHIQLVVTIAPYFNEVFLIWAVLIFNTITHIILAQICAENIVHYLPFKTVPRMMLRYYDISIVAKLRCKDFS